MNFLKSLSFSMVTIIIFGCTTENKREIVIDENLKAVGDIDADSVYNGVVTFYDLKTNQFLYSCNYKDNVLEGERVDYYKNGKPYSRQMYTNGMLHGFTSFYDTTNTLASQQYFYYDIKMGPVIEWSLGKEKEYYFYSFDNDLLFNLYYDELNSKRITDVQKNFFFFNIKKISDRADSLSRPKREYFLYLPKPPKFDFDYSVVEIDTSYNVLSTELEIKSKEPWTTFSVNSDKSENFAIRLIIKDSINKTNYTMFKRI